MAYTHEIRVGFGDCDPAKIAYTARIPWWALDAIDAWWEHNVAGGAGGGWYHIEFDRGFGSPFVHMSLDFRAPITPRHRLICKCAPTRLGTTSVEFRVTGAQNGVLCFEGRFVCVFTNPKEFAKAPPPEDVRAIIEGLIEPDFAGV